MLAAQAAPPLSIFLIFLRLGLTSFGGPVAHLGYFREEFVARRKWLDEHAYADLVALCQLLPGPASSQVGIALGLAHGGIRGALADWTGRRLSVMRIIQRRLSMKALHLIAVSAAALCASAAYADTQKPGAYTPGMGEIMGTTQMRHAKLWFAGRAKNWELARYELDEIREGLDGAIKYYPVFKGAPVSAMLDKYTSPPLSDLARAIDEKDSAKFARAFDGLTSACNGCHRAAEHGYIVIKRPANLQYSNQEFAVQKK